MKTKRAISKPRRRKPAAPIDKWALRLYVAGQTPRSEKAFKNLKRICETELKGRYHIEVIDLIKNPRLARENQILAVPTLVRKLPLPIRNIIGDLSDFKRVLVGLELVGDEATAPGAAV